jgi:hypothetical protein
LPQVDRAAAGDLTAAGRLGDRPVNGQLVQVQTDDLVVGGRADPEQRAAVPGLSPLLQPTAQRPVRAVCGGHALVAAAVHQRRDQVIEHDPVGDPPAMTPPGVGRGELRALCAPDQSGELDPQWLDERCWQHGHGSLQ